MARLLARSRDGRANMMVLLCYGAGLTLEKALTLRAARTEDLEGWIDDEMRNTAFAIARQAGRLYAVETHSACGGMITVQVPQALRILNLAAERAGLVGRIGRHTLTRSYVYTQVIQNGQTVEAVANHLDMTPEKLQRFMHGGRGGKHD